MEGAYECYLDSTREVNRLEGYLGAIEVALEASKREATATQVVVVDA